MGTRKKKKPDSFWLARGIWVIAGLFIIPLIATSVDGDPKAAGSLVFLIVILGLVGWIIDQS